MTPLLFKFSDKTHLINFIKSGEMLFRHYSYFKNGDSTSINGRFDKYEFCDEIHQLNKFNKVSIDDLSFNVVPEIGKPVRINYEGYLDYNYIYCMTGFNESEEILENNNRKIFHPKLFDDFGEDLIVIHNPLSFRNSIDTYFKNQNIKYDMKKIEYVDINTYSGEMGPFKKISHYSYQVEYRIALLVEDDVPFLKFNIGTLENCTSGPINKQKIINIIKNDTAIIS